MDKKYFPLFLVFILFSCSASSDFGASESQVRKWIIPGSASFSSDTTTDVKLALFYVNNTTLPTTLSTSYSLVSSVVNLGKTPNTNVDFSLNVDCTKTTPSDKQLLCLFMWIDTAGNNTFTAGDKSGLCISKASSGSMSFTDGTVDASCYYYYVGYNGDQSADLGTYKGWNQSFGNKFINIKKAVTYIDGNNVIPKAVVECSF